MRKNIIAVFLFVASCAPVHAALLIDGMGAYTMTGDAENQPGFGAGIGCTVTGNVNVFLKAVGGSTTERADSPRQVDYSHSMFMGVVQYGYQIPGVPLTWNTSLGLGASRTEIEYKDPGTALKEETGIAFAAWTGLMLAATQHIGPFLEVGYHRSVYDRDFKDDTIGGFQFFAGIRLTLFGKNRSIFADY